MIKIFDTHAHYDDEAFAEDREEIIASLPLGGVEKVCDVGASLEGTRDAVRIAREHDGFYAAVGIHPSNVMDFENYIMPKEEELFSSEAFARYGASKDPLDELRGYAMSWDFVRAIGEIGLDYHYDPTEEEKALQRKWFEAQLDLARELKLPVIIHSRDAAADTMEIMKAKNSSEIGGVIHCYSYSPEMAKEYVKMGFFIGVGGVVTFKNSRKLKETVAVIPLEKIVLETDCPYLAPTPHRGERNSSLFLPLVVETIAGIKGVSVDEVYECTWNNAHNLYRL